MFIGAALYGLADAAHALARDTLTASPAQQLLLALADALGTPLLILPGAALLLLRPPTRPWPAFLWGVLCAALLDVAVWSVHDAPPLLYPLSLSLVLLLLFGALTRLIHTPRAQVAAIIGLTFALTSRGLGAQRVFSPRPEPPAHARDVLLITVSGLRADAISADKTTPNLQRFAAESAAFTQTYAPIADTFAAHRAALTGRQPWEPAPAPTLATALRAHGWRTGAFISAAPLAARFQEDFQIYDDDFRWLQGWADTLPGRVLLTTPPQRRLGGRTTEQAIDWLTQTPSPAFVWVHLHDPVAPYAPPPPWDTAFYTGDPRDPAHTSLPDDMPSWLNGVTDVDWPRAQYQGEVAYVDRQIGRLLEALDATGREDALVVVAGVFGESLGEQGLWFDHRGGLHDAVVHVPLLIRLPGVTPMGMQVSSPAELVDVTPTILDLLQLSTPEGVTGYPLREALIEGTADIHPFIHGADLTVTPPRLSLRRPGAFVYIEGGGKDPEYFDLRGEAATASPLPRALSGLPEEMRRFRETVTKER